MRNPGVIASRATGVKTTGLPRRLGTHRAHPHSGLMAPLPRQPDTHAGIHRGVHYSLRRNGAPGYWRYAYTIGEKVRSGRVQGSLALLAIRRVEMRIDRDMRGRAE
ncbi:hypothetical protein [Bradyrhizobium sp. USDA 4486]